MNLGKVKMFSLLTNVFNRKKKCSFFQQIFKTQVLHFLKTILPLYY